MERFICKWAGADDDDTCKSCNGISFEENGKTIQCDASESKDKKTCGCSGYEPDKNKPIKNDLSEEKVEDNKMVEEDTKKPNNGESEPSSDKQKEFSWPKEAKIVKLAYMSSATVKIKDNYYKFEAGEEWDMSNAELTQENVDTCRKNLFGALNANVDEQIEDILKNE